MSNQKINCHQCGEEFEVLTKEYNRQKKKGREYFFCSRACSSRFSIIKSIHSEEGKSRAAIANKNREYTKSYSPYTYYLNKARNRKKLMYPQRALIDIDKDYLESIWTGKCAISGIDILHKSKDKKTDMFSASLDRIDSSKGYIKGNVQFVALGVNYAKNGFTNEETLEFIKAIKLQC